MSSKQHKGFCNTCKHERIRKDSLRTGIPLKDWSEPCQSCDIDVNYNWEACD